LINHNINPLELEQAIFVNQIKLLFKQYIIGFISSMSISIAVLILLWESGNSTHLVYWFIILNSILLFRLYIVFFYRSNIDSTDYASWYLRYKLFLVSAFLLGATWGLIGTVLFPQESSIQQVFVIVILVGLISGALPIMFYVKKVYFAFVVPIIVPFMISHALEEESTYIALNFITLFYFIMMVQSARRGEDSIIESIKLRFENMDLISELKQTKINLTHSKDDLEERVEERTLNLIHLKDELYQQKNLAEMTLSSIADGIITTNARGEIIQMNASAEKLTGYTEDNIAGLKCSEYIKLIDEFKNTPIENPVERSLYEKRTINNISHCLLVSRDNTTIAIKESIAPIFSLSGEVLGAVIVIHDINKERIYRLQLAHQATHDKLTGLYNRFAFEEKLRDVLKSRAAGKQQHAMIYIDLDDFKVVNDSCGHAAGDELLKQISLIMPRYLHSENIIARLGGDEFGVLIQNTSTQISQTICDNLLKQIRAFRFNWQKKTFNIGASFGLFVFSSKSQSIDNIMSISDIACYTAKERGRNRVHTYSPNDKELIGRRSEINWVNKISQSIEDDRLILYSQPIVSSRDANGKVRHAEILLRMLDDKGKIIHPAPLISAAERYHMMPKIDRWVISKIFEYYEDGLLNLFNGNYTIAINLSGISLADNQLLLFIEDLLRNSSFPAKCICFEITETAAISNMAIALNFINKMRKLGCKFAIDDFGSGVSSLAYLKNLPVDYVKIDGCFVRDMANDPIDYAMVESIHKLVTLNGKKSIAEYVESKEIMDNLIEIGVDYLQGYAISKPIPLIEESTKAVTI